MSNFSPTPWTTKLPGLLNPKTGSGRINPSTAGGWERFISGYLHHPLYPRDGCILNRLGLWQNFRHLGQLVSGHNELDLVFFNYSWLLMGDDMCGVVCGAKDYDWAKGINDSLLWVEQERTPRLDQWSSVWLGTADAQDYDLLLYPLSVVVTAFFKRCLSHGACHRPLWYIGYSSLPTGCCSSCIWWLVALALQRCIPYPLPRVCSWLF